MLQKLSYLWFNELNGFQTTDFVLLWFFITNNVSKLILYFYSLTYLRKICLTKFFIRRSKSKLLYINCSYELPKVRSRSHRGTVVPRLPYTTTPWHTYLLYIHTLKYNCLIICIFCQINTVPQNHYLHS